VGWFQALEDAFKREPEGEHKAKFELKLQEARGLVEALQPAWRLA
jgi:hypothetical protein